jgi:DNA-binding HxlR family transcriptional regulator
MGPDECGSSIAIAQQRSRSRGCSSLGSESRSASGSIRQILDRVADRWSLLVVAVLDHRTMRLPEPSSLSAALGADHRQLQSSA